MQKGNIYQKTVERPLKRAVDDPDSIALLRGIMEGLGYDWRVPNDRAKEDMAEQLGKLVGKKWTGKYIHNILSGAILPSQLFKAAMGIMAATLDDYPEILARAKPMTLYVIGEVEPNSLVLASSRRCDNPACRIRNFIPRVWNQTYCTPDCKAEHKKIKQQARAMERAMELAKRAKK